MDKAIARKVFSHCKIEKIGAVMPLSEISVEWGVSSEDIIESVKFLRDNRFDSMDGWELEFSNDYSVLKKIKSFENFMRDEKFAQEDFRALMKKIDIFKR